MRQSHIIKGNTREYKGIQGNTGEYKRIQGNTGKLKEIQENTGEYIREYRQENTKECIRNTSKYREIENSYYGTL